MSRKEKNKAKSLYPKEFLKNHFFQEFVRQNGFLLENISEQLKGLAEATSLLDGRADRMERKIDSIIEQTGGLSIDNTFMKEEIVAVRKELKKKVDYDTLVLLEQRISTLEAKVRR